MGLVRQEKEVRVPRPSWFGTYPKEEEREKIVSESADDKRRREKLETKPKSAFEADKEALERQKARDERDKAVNSERTRASGVYVPIKGQPIDDVVTEAQTGVKTPRGRK